MAALSLLPLVFGTLVSSLRARSFSLHVAAILLLLVLCVAPVTYGAATLVEKAWRRASRTTARVGRSGVRFDLLGADGAASEFFDGLRAAAPAAGAVLYMFSRDLGLELADRRLLVRQRTSSVSSS
jgi:hypothetical protein